MNFKSFFKNKKLLDKAFTHRSYLNEHKNEHLESNERLEFLGDAVLELIVSLYLYKKYPLFPEGKLTTMRSKLVQTKTLAMAATKLKLGQNLKFSKGEKASNGSKNLSILADTFEALTGAIYLDQGFKQTTGFIQKNLLIPIEKLSIEQLPQDYKSKLQEVIQVKGKPAPIYKIIKTNGPDNHKIFKVAVLVAGKPYAEGLGASKQIAEQMAAKKALKERRKQC